MYWEVLRRANSCVSVLAVLAVRAHSDVMVHDRARSVCIEDGSYD